MFSCQSRRFTKETVDTFFKMMRDEARLLEFALHKIFNYDETGITVVQGKSIV